MAMEQIIIGAFLIAGFIAAIYARFYGEKMQEDPTPEPTPEPPPIAKKKSPLATFCTKIKDYEGYILPGGKDASGKFYPKGSRSYQNNNPGNCRFYYGGYLPIYGQVKRDGDGFAIFKDYQTGWLYLNNLCKNYIHNHPKWNFYDFFNLYAPESENDSKAYAKYVAKGCSQPPLAVLSEVIEW